MATQGTYLVNGTVNDANQLLSQLLGVRTIITRITERMEALGVEALVGYEWPEGYTQANFVTLYTALDLLPGLVIEDAVRNAVMKLVSSIQ